MKNNTGGLAAPFPYFGGKSGASETVWAAFGDVANYVEPFAGSAAMLLNAPTGNAPCAVGQLRVSRHRPAGFLQAPTRHTKKTN